MRRWRLGAGHYWAVTDRCNSRAVARKLHQCGVDLPAVPPAPSDEAPQRIVKVRRDYNSWVAHETMEDYALRYTPQRFRKWST